MPPEEDDAAGLPMRQRLVHARLLTLLMLLRSSAQAAYSRRTGFGELHRRVLVLVGNFEGLTSVELVALTGQEKAQISRAIRALSDAGLIERASLRARITLSPAGEDAFATIIDVARARDALLAGEMDEAELAGFAATTQVLIERGAVLLAQERQLGTGQAGAEEAVEGSASPMPERVRQAGVDRPLSLMIAPALMTLVSYVQRSATIEYRRETGLSNFEWRVMSQVGEYAPLGLSRLIAITGRDKSQVGRTVKRLEGEGLVLRQAEPGRRDILLDCTDAGRAVYARMCRIAIDREDFLFATIPAEDKSRYLATLSRMTANAEAMLAEERAIDAAR